MKKFIGITLAIICLGGLIGCHYMKDSVSGLSLHNMYLQTQGKGISTTMTTFTPAMIEEAYSAYIKAVGEDEYMKQKSKYQKSLRKEQKCWEEWVECRKEISQNFKSANTNY